MPNTIDIRRAAEPDIAAILLLYAGDELHGASVDTKPGESHRRAWAATLPRFAHRPAALDHGRYQRFAAFLAERGLITAPPPVATFAADLFEEPAP